MKSLRKWILLLSVIGCIGSSASFGAEAVKHGDPNYIPTLIYHARELRDILAADPYRPKYHFVPPEGFWNDVNGMIYWKGRYHLFYLSRTVDPELNARLEKIEGQRPVMETWGHSSSIDLVHWIHHPFALVPTYDGSMPRGIYSGDMMDNMKVPTIIAHVPGQGTSIWEAEDDMLIKWKSHPGNPVITKGNAPEEVNVFDVAGWQENGLYYALVGNVNKTPGYEGDSTSLFSSVDLGKWEYIGPFYRSDRKWTPEYQDAACIDFFPLEDKYMLVTHVHKPKNHSQYYIGSYEPGKRFIPEQHGLFESVGTQVAAPETMLDDQGRRIFMAWNMGGDMAGGTSAAWKSMSTLPRVFSLNEKGTLEQRPIEELKKLRYNHRSGNAATVRPEKDIALSSIGGTCIEIGLTINGGDYASVGVKVFQAADGSEETVVGYDAANKQLFIDFGKSQMGGASMTKYTSNYMRDHDVNQEQLTRQNLPFELVDGEELDLRIFIDQCIVEVFANDRQVLVQNVYPKLRTSTGVSLFSKGGDAEFSRIEAWDMHWSNAF